MTSSKFITITLSLFVAFTFAFGGINYYVDDFGLWQEREEIRIWSKEKTTKYLLSYNYIPNNFEGVIIGPSVSVNMDTHQIDSHKIYNLSMNGANISELKYAVDKVYEHGGTKYLIVCLYPYITKDHGRKSDQIDEKEYFGSLASFLPIKISFNKLLFWKFPDSDLYHSSTRGYVDSNLLKKHINFKDLADKHKYEKIVIDPIAYNELREVLSLARKNNTKILAYYFPVYNRWMNQWVEKGDWAYYQEKMSVLFQENELVWDLNTDEFNYITSDYSSYSDGHLSNLGAERVIKVIEKMLKKIDQDSANSNTKESLK